MRILFLTPSVRLLGARRSLLALIQALSNQHETLTICPGQGGLEEELRHRGAPVSVIAHGAYRKLSGRFRAELLQLPAIAREVRRFQPRVIHCNEFHSVPQGTRVGSGGIRGSWRGNPGEKSIPVVGHVRLGISPRQIRNYRMGHCCRIVAVSEACRRLFDGSGLEERVRVVYNGVDLSQFQASAERRRAARERLLAELGWPAECLIAGLFGLISPRKNQLLAAEAVALANARGVPARLLLAGDAFKSTEGYGEALRARIEAGDLRGKVHWVPFQDDILDLYNACDLNLLISDEEGFGRTIIEAGALGVPSIGSAIGGIPELIAEGETGWIVGNGAASPTPPHSPVTAEGLADVLEKAWGNRGELPAMGEKARRLATEKFSIEAHRDAMVRVWEEAVG
ncbi:MAG: glycosyltransferase family 4 protein [Sumerlaeia bacterium]